MKKTNLIIILTLLFPFLAYSQIEVNSDGNMNTNQNSIYFRKDANYLSGIGYGVYGGSSQSLTFFADKYRYMEYRQANSNILLAKFYFGSSINYSYTDFYGDIALNKGHWTGGIESDILPFSGHDMPTILPYSDWYGALGTSYKSFGAGYIDHVFYLNLTDLSDLNVKENISDLGQGLDKIIQLRPVKFDIKSTFFDSIPDEARNKVIEQNKNSLGFIAQDVQQVIPELVNEIPGTDLQGINTIDLIPVLVKAIQEQQAQIDNLKKITNIQEMDIVSIKEHLGLVEEESTKKSAPLDNPLLYQNNPNPFNKETTIQAYVPSIIKEASLVIYDLDGVALLSENIVDRGDISIVIPGTEFSEGIYIYSLLIDGRIVDSKRIVITQ